MEWLENLGAIWLPTVEWLLGLGLGLGLLAHFMPCNANPPVWRSWRIVRTDLMYWLVVPLFTGTIRQMMLIVGVIVLFAGREPDFLPVKAWPLWLQCIAILAIQDVILYIVHRFFHTRLAWKFHAIHHSPEVLDWTSASRFHPVNNLLEFAVADVAVVLMGFPPLAVVFLAPFNMIYSAMVHANLNWTFGPLRYVLASPVFHRWHHTTEEEGLDKNFASTFPILDLICGTFYMPTARVPERYGTTRSPVPAGFLGQLVYPLHGYGVRAFMWHRPLASSVCAAAVLIMGGVGYQALDTWNWNKYFEPAPTPDSMVETLPDPAAYPSVAGSYRVGDKFEAAVTAVAVTGDGRRFARASEDGTIKVWDAGATTSRTLTGHGRATTCAAISSDGQKVISASRDRTVKIWDADTGAELQSLSGNASPVLSISIAHDGNRFVSGSADGEIRIWDRDGQEQRTLSRQAGAVPSVAISADGRRVAAAMMSTARIWDVETGKVVTLAGHDDMVYCVAISPDGQHVVTGSFDQTLKVWDAATGKEERTLRGHKRNVYSVAISQDGQWIVSGGYDTTARVWQASTGREMFTLVGGHEAMVVSVAITADGGQILSGDMNGVVKLWNPRGNPDDSPVSLLS